MQHLHLQNLLCYQNYHRRQRRHHRHQQQFLMVYLKKFHLRNLGLVCQHRLLLMMMFLIRRRRCRQSFQFLLNLQLSMHRRQLM